MTKFRDPTAITQDALVAAMLGHILCGVYIWEFVTTLEYEWSVIRGRRRYRWTIWIYSIARVAALLAVACWFVIRDSTRPIDCQVATYFIITFSFLTMSASSLLIVIRIIAIWNRNIVAVVTAVSLWGINVAFLIQGTVGLRTAWVSSLLACMPVNMERRAPNLISMLVIDIALFLIMLLGLFRMRRDIGGRFGLSQLLWRQGVIWLLLATVTQAPQAVFNVLNLNESFNIMFPPLSWITMAIAATRMHRSLVDFAFESTNVVNEGIPKNSLAIPKTKGIRAVSTLVDRTEVTAHVVSEQHSKSHVKGNDPHIIIDQVPAHSEPNVFRVYDNV